MHRVVDTSETEKTLSDIATGGITQNKGPFADFPESTEIVITAEQRERINAEFLRQIPDKDLYEEVNRRQWERINDKRLQYEAKGKPVMD